MKYAFLLFFLFIRQGNCNQFLYVPSIEIPTHLHNLYSSLQKIEGFDFDKYIQQIDRNHKLMNPTTLSELSRSEISKFLIKHRPDQNMLDYDAEIKSINKILKNAIEDENLSLFSKWFLTSIQKDLILLFKQSEMHTYLVRKKSKRPLNTLPLKRIDKKYLILSSWYSLLKDHGPLIFNNKVNKILPSLLVELLRAQDIFITISRIKTNKLKPTLKYFKKMSFSEIDSEQKKKKVDEFEKFLGSLPAIIKNPIQNIEIPVRIPSPINDWFPKDDISPESLFPQQDPTYTPPEILPEPINDWLMDA